MKPPKDHMPPHGQPQTRTQGVTPQSVQHQLLTCWRDTRVGTGLPLRKDINPLTLGPAIPFAFVLEYRAPAPPKFRLVGSKLNEAFGLDLRGMPLYSMLAPELRDDFHHYATAVFDKESVLSVHLLAQDGDTNAQAELTILPLWDDFGACTKALGALVPMGHLAAPPLRFTQWTTINLRQVPPSTNAYKYAPPNRRALQFAEPSQPTWDAPKPAAPMKKAPALASERPYLTLVRD